MKKLVDVVFANVGLGCIILLMILEGFMAGVFFGYGYYANHLLSEPLRFYSMFVFPYLLGVCFFVWRWLLPIFVGIHKKELAKFLEAGK